MCFGQILGTLYIHLAEGVNDGNMYNVLSVNVDEESGTGTAIIKTKDGVEEWRFDSTIDIWVRIV